MGGRRTVAMGVEIAVGVTLVYTVLGAIVRPAMYSDSGWGFLGWYLGQGLPFNTVPFIDRADLSRDIPGFASWWTPGQHLLPGLLERAGLELGLAMSWSPACSACSDWEAGMRCTAASASRPRPARSPLPPSR